MYTFVTGLYTCCLYIKERAKINNKHMGGNAFEGTEKLTPQEYAKITSQIYQLISPICLKIQPYIPLPQKQLHGDVDFLLTLKQGYTLSSIIQLMKLQKKQYILNNNMTANTFYHKKQVDFNVAADDAEFQRCRFYKSYGGFGAFLGLMLHSKFVKLNEDGLFCCCYFQHLKMEFKVTQSIDQILLFYGLQPEIYHKGFSNRQSLFQFMTATRFLEPKEFVAKEIKCMTKLIASFQKYLSENLNKIDKTAEKVEDPISLVLKQFNKRAEYQQAWKQKMEKESAKKERTSKWNGMHIIKVFGVPSKQVNALKRKFESSFGSRQQYEKYIEESEFQEIVCKFGKVCQLKAG